MHDTQLARSAPYGETAAMPTPPLLLIDDRLANLIVQANDMALALEQHGDRLFGPTPTALHHGSGSKDIEPMGQIEQIHLKLDRLANALDRVSEQVHRNTRLA